ncbi:MAG: hypothetical protein ACK4GL_10525 [Flavobacteriales bacterium]
MLLKKFSLDRELTEERNREMSRLIRELDSLLEDQAAEDKRISAYFPNAELIGEDEFPFQVFDREKLFSLETIKNTCIKFRLRFLSANLYKGKLPYEAISAIKQFERKIPKEEIEGYHIMAPSEFFQLKDRYSDPLLFAQLKNGKYVLLHKWGSDFEWYTKLLNFPLRDFKSIVISASLLGLLITFVASYFGIANDVNIFKSILLKVPIFVVSTGFFTTIAIIYGLVTYKDFSDDNWNSRYFN